MSTGPDPVSPPSDLSPVLPEKFLGLFRTRLCSGDLDTVPLSPFKVALKLSDLDLSEPINPMPTGVKSSVQVFRDEAVALYSNPTSDPNNITALKSLVNQLAEDFFLFRGYSLDYVYLGMVAIEPTALFDYLELTYDDDSPAADDNQNNQIIELVEDRMRPNCYTRIHGEPWDGYPEFFQHWDQGSFLGPCLDSKDRTPGLLMLTPGNSGTTTTITLTAGVLTLEDGRLSQIYDKPVPISCGCETVTCAFIYVRTTTTGSVPLPGVTVSLIQGGTTIATGITDGMVISVPVGNHGAGYRVSPVVTFSGGGGFGAQAIAGISGDANGNVTTITIINPGFGYTSPPTVTLGVPDVGANRATATATIAAQVMLGYVNTGTSTVTASKPGHVTSTGPITLSSCVTTIVTRNLP